MENISSAIHTVHSASIPQEYDARSPLKRFVQRQRLRAIVARHNDMFDPPNTAEAFIKLEAAMDDAKIAEEHDMLDPPTTAERFAHIEAAIDEVLATTVTTAPTKRHSKMLALLCSNSESAGARQVAASSLTRRSDLRDTPMPSHTSDVNTARSGKIRSQLDADIFRSNDAVTAFANQAYQSARKKYL